MLLDPEREGSESLADESPESAPPTSALVVPILLEPRGDRPDPLVFRQGAHPPFGIRWYGLTSLFGHLRNFVSRAIATESVDTRDWMKPNKPEDLVRYAARVLVPGVLEKATKDGGASKEAGSPSASSRDTEPTTLADVLKRPVWIDFAADTGDDRDVSAKVGAMLASTYTHEGRHLPRGDVLVFGGDVSYPVATADEIYKRLVLPWNEELRRVGASSKKRVLLGAPGNHDWYDGLDGFGRLFRRRIDEPFTADDRDTTPNLGKRLRQRPGRKLGLTARTLHLDEVGSLYGALFSIFRSVRAFFTGKAIKRRRRLVLRGYEPIQEASYFALPLAPGLDLWGADRQLGRVDFRQRAYFKKRRRETPNHAVLFVAGDPAMAYGLRNEPGARMLAACRLHMERDNVFFLAGDFHHYERRAVGKSMHVIAGGGGAFLHGTRVAPYPKPAGDPAVVYPSGAASRALALGVPVKITIGRAGLLAHAVFGLLASLEIGTRSYMTAGIESLGLWLLFYFIAIQEAGSKSIRALAAFPFALSIGFLPIALAHLVPRLPFYASEGAEIVTCAFAGAFIFGCYLTVLMLSGLEHQQAFTVLGHPGYKHFVRLCVHPEGKIEAWTIGKDDVLAEGPPLLIDHFDWKPTR